jgi:MmyB-like transcription regulator ligand binding domain
MLHLMFDPKGMRPFIANWEDLAKGLFERVYRESVGRVVDDRTRELIAALLAYPDVNSDWKNPVALSFMPVIPMSFVKDDRLLNYFSMVTTVGTPRTVAAQELRIESMFPADEETEARHVALMRAA